MSSSEFRTPSRYNQDEGKTLPSPHQLPSLETDSRVWRTGGLGRIILWEINLKVWFGLYEITLPGAGAIV